MLKEMVLKSALLLFLSLLIINYTPAQTTTNPKTQSKELGKVTWYRSYNEALKLSKAQRKPILILFQEVPGCSTCRNYGQNVLSHPLMVEAIENEFIPLAIFNNKKGEDLKILKKYNEPTWNNPVVRIVDKTGRNLVQRVAGNYSMKGIYEAMEVALRSQKKVIPEYMKILKTEINATGNKSIKEAYFKMYCFWSGESHLGIMHGVIATEPGFMSGHEVVKVLYDEKKISKENLISHGMVRDCTWIKKGKNYRKDNDPQYYLKQTYYKYLPLTALQKTKINSALGHRHATKIYLSPRQKKWLKMIQTKSIKAIILYDKDFETAWWQMRFKMV